MCHPCWDALCSGIRNYDVTLKVKKVNIITFTAWIFLVSSKFCRFWSRRRLNAASAGSHPFLSSRPRSCSSTPLFHNPSTLTCCLGLFNVIGSCPSSLLGQLGSEVSDLCLIGRNGMVIVALCCHSGDNKGRDFTVNSARAQKNVIYLSQRLWRFCAEALIILPWFFCWESSTYT